ncbi:hypothetical protein [Segetibacter aerophilus]|uniref:Uncharacterized protein n=1 Tax=Segetibacter aerophilus TaxID=670293 RepID=A0A512BD51_9BACT|nr:hypothetical protein [Segetibacter aerophilus]GEO09893.1 hypothetical protein SAE01_23890 [Segetibacter aerophilus]
MKYVILSVIALTFTISNVDAQARPAKARKPKKHIGKHPNGNPPAVAVYLKKKSFNHS